MATARKCEMQVTQLSDTELQITREFDAPRETVFRALTDPTLLPKWWGPRRYKTVVDTMEVRPGGTWRMRNIAADGGEHAFRGEFREVTPPERIVWTFEYEPLPGHISVETLTLTERDGRTLLTVHDVFSSKEDLDGMVNSGMESGARESYERLDDVLAELR
ncbi:MAG TPA: SRPBCC family protein [Candidatus Limnocylindria bacterium]|nr:SRPBCC family protein [Candidatus Limnocylindria bacterium]